MKKLIAILAALALTFTVAGCESDAKVSSRNVSTEADNFKVQRKIVGVNLRTDKYLLYAEGRCSVEREGGWVTVICKVAEDAYRKQLITDNPDLSLVVTQEEPIDVSVYHTKIVVKPENLLPNLELSTGKQ